MSTASATFVLPEDLSIYEAATLRAGLLDWVRPGEVQQLDGAAVERVDLAGVQVLLMLQEQCRRSGGALHLVEASAALRDALDLLGLRLEQPAAA